LPAAGPGGLHPPLALTLSVADNGTGIPAEVRDRLFRPYYTTKKHGTGLGLFVVRRIVEAHGGSVAVDSEPGRGATFTLTLPAAEACGTRSVSDGVAPPGEGTAVSGRGATPSLTLRVPHEAVPPAPEVV
jgi:hypothetical protein